MLHTSFLSKWTRLAIIIVALFNGTSEATPVSKASNAGITIDNCLFAHANIRHGVIATYSKQDGLSLQFNSAAMDAADKQELAKGYFVVTDDITLTAAECNTLNAPMGTKIARGKFKIERRGDSYMGATQPAGAILHYGKDGPSTEGKSETTH